MRFDFITTFPSIFDCYLGTSILKRAQEKRLVSFHAHDLRKWTTDKHHTVDDKPYGGGAGMVLMAEPILRAVEEIKNIKKSRISRDQEIKKKTKIVVFSAKGKQFDQKLAYDWAKKYDRLILISGRYEGIDERVVKILRAEEISIGPYVLTDGDVAAMVVASAITRLLPGAIKLESLTEESFSLFERKENREKRTEKEEPKTKIANSVLSSQFSVLKKEYPHYTRPEVLIYRGKKYRVPKVLLSGDHQKIRAWRKKTARVDILRPLC